MNINLDTVMPSIEPCQSCPGIEGHGEGIKYNNKYYFYRDGKKIPKNKVASLIWQGNYCGRINGDVEYIYVAWNGDSFTVLSHEYSYSRKYNKLLPADAILLRQRELKKLDEDLAKMPRCKVCNGIAYIFEKDQNKDECLSCFKKRITE